ncbi:MAG: FAD-dependent oxidoreductase [Proteobacteria bacterium]|nr:FAD-dependent oxidoreductase [Pseudomonadota bacterium]
MDKFDAIVVGAGLAGLASAHTLAGAGLEVLVMERGDYPGAKNLSGGRLYVNPVRDLFPGLWEGAPFERHIVREGFALLSPEHSVSVDYSGEELRREPYQSYSVLRSKFDRWLGERVEEKGAVVLPKVRVDGVIRQDGKVVGVRAGGDELAADVVIACDGALSLIPEMAGLREPAPLEHYAVGVKEIIRLDPEAIESRFGVEGDQGAARLFVGEVTRGRFGGGFLYTNKDSLSLGVVLGIEGAMEGDPIDVPALLDDFKARPEIAGLIRGGETVEYGAHLIPEGGFRALSRLFGDGILVAGDSAGLALNMGVTVRGMEFALASGYFAAQAVLRAREAGSFGAEALAVYEKLLEQSFVLQDLKSFRETPAVLSNPRFFGHYPELLGRVLGDVYAVPAGPKERLYPTVRKHLTLGEMWGLVKDLRKVTKV